jgi:hypothetical protein
MRSDDGAVQVLQRSGSVHLRVPAAATAAAYTGTVARAL